MSELTLTQIFSLPLLTKELIEQAHKKRTYTFRMIYAISLYGVALFQYQQITGEGTTAGLMNFGRGKELFDYLIRVQAGMILLLLPPITCGALTVEKEKDTLALLLLTKLNPWTIVFEKFLSRIFAMGTYQLLSLPLFAIVYGLGGVEMTELQTAITALVSMTIVVGSISIVCSTWFRTTSAAFVMTYVMLFLGSCFFSIFSAPLILGTRAQSAAFGHEWLVKLFENAFMLGTAALMSGLCLLLAANFLVVRAFIPNRNLVLEAFQYLDQFFNRLNKQTTGGIVLVPERESLPVFQPIAWRETRKKSLGTFRYQFRILMLLLTPLICSIVMTMDGRNDFTSPFRVYPLFFWVVSVICLTIHSTAAIPSERIRQTLDVLLVIPISSRDFVREKLSGVRRLIKILAVPFGVLIGFQAIWSWYVMQGRNQNQNAELLLELAITSLAALIYMPLIMWIGFQLGLRMRTQMQAVLSTFAIIGAICALPIIFHEICGSFFDLEAIAPTYAQLIRFMIIALRWFSPIVMITGANQPSGFHNLLEMSTVVALHFAFYGLLSSSLRWNAFKNFSRIVRRVEACEISKQDS